jgi:phospho-N-acetylmuramoyl-pentapeptide-transferase
MTGLSDYPVDLATPLAQIVAQTAPINATLTPKVIVVGLLMAGLSFLLTWALGKPFIGWLRANKMGKLVRDDGPQTHLKKTGTPTMGGLMMHFSILIVTVGFILVPNLVQGNGGLSVLLPIGVVVACAILGAIDDLLTLVGQRSRAGEDDDDLPAWRKWLRVAPGASYGLKAKFKMAWLLGISLAAAITLYLPLELQKVYVPFIREPIVLPWFIYIPAAVLLISGFSNAVNLTDGMDSLAAITAASAFGAYAIIGYIQLQPQVVWLAFIAAGACFGFLWYNAHPAQVFMGDTGSLTLGALLAVLAFQTNQWLMLPIIGGVFVLEALSVMLQVSYFKYTKKKYGEGRRFFRMSPLHNHFELSGWSETQTSMRFWLFGTVLALVGVTLALL